VTLTGGKGSSGNRRSRTYSSSNALRGSGLLGRPNGRGGGENLERRIFLIYI